MSTSLKILSIILFSSAALTTFIIGLVKYYSYERKFYRRKPLSDEAYTALETRLNNISYVESAREKQDAERAYLLQNTLGKKFRLRASQFDKVIKLFHFINGTEKARRIAAQYLILREELEIVEKKKIADMLFGNGKKDG